MRFIKVENHIVKHIVSATSADKLQESCVNEKCPTGEWITDPVPKATPMRVGDDIRMYDDNWKLRPRQELVDEGYLQLTTAVEGDPYPEGTVLEKIEDNEVVPKNRYDFALEGLAELGPNEYLDHETHEIKTGTLEELLYLGEITAQEFETRKAAEVRSERDALLAEVDAIALNPLRWSSLSESEQANFAGYRQQLLDVPQQAGFPSDISWPDRPESLGDNE